MPVSSSSITYFVGPPLEPGLACWSRYSDLAGGTRRLSLVFGPRCRGIAKKLLTIQSDVDFHGFADSAG